MNIFDAGEFKELRRRFNTGAFCEEVVIRYPTDSFFNKVRKAVETDRRGEVVFCVIRPNGKVIMVTCEDYPEGIFRIPTGGIGHDEDIVEAVHRECMEELGLSTEITSFAGVLKIRFEYKNDSVMFFSYIFILKETGGNLLADASDDEVSEILEADLDELQAAVGKLNSITGKWSHWGRFRYTTSNRVLQYLRERG